MALHLARSDIEGIFDPDFGPDPKFNFDRAMAGLRYANPEHTRLHLEYMHRVIWPFMATLRRVLVGQRDMTTYTVIGRFAVGDTDYRDDGSVRLGFGHIYFSSFPGSGKTLIAKIPALITGGTASRFQGMAGTLPQDYTGNRIIDMDHEGRRVFRIVKGPAFSQVQLLDEFFRSDPRTQSGALQALGEGLITIAGETYEVDSFALITGNPIESKGVYPASEAFLDRIMFKIVGRRFSAEEYSEIILRTERFPQIKFKIICDMARVKEIQKFFFEHVFVSPGIRTLMGRFAEITNDPHGKGYLLDLKEEFKDSIVVSGLSGRGVGHWRGAAKVLAAMRYRNCVMAEDIRKILIPVLRHRMIFTPGVLPSFSADWKCSEQEVADRIIGKLIAEAW